MNIEKPASVDLGSYAMAKLGFNHRPSNFRVYKALKDLGYDIEYTNTPDNINRMYAILMYL